MLKKSVVALALFAALVVSVSQSYAAPRLAADLRVLSAQSVWNDAETLTLSVANRGPAATGPCRVEVRFYGDNVGAMVQDQPIAVASAICAPLAGSQSSSVTVRIPWVTFVKLTGLRGPTFYFRATIDPDHQVEEERITVAGADLGCGEFNNTIGFQINKNFTDLFAK